MCTYVEEVVWNCEWCDVRQEFRYLGASPQFCSNICKFRARKVERSLARGDLNKAKRLLLEEVRGCTGQRYTALEEMAAWDGSSSPSSVHRSDSNRRAAILTQTVDSVRRGLGLEQLYIK